MTTSRLVPARSWPSESASRCPGVSHRLGRKLATGLLAVGLIVTQSFGQSVDPSFAPNIDGVPEAMAVQPDGKILIGGTFSVIDGITRSNIARLHPDGSVDSDFNPGADGKVTSLAVQADGRVLAAGTFSQLGDSPRIRLGRLNPDGTLDPGFHPAVTGDGSPLLGVPLVRCLAIQANGKVLVGGAFTELAGCACTNLGRLSADGTVDSNFCAQADSEVGCIAVQSDGKLLVGGRFLALDGQARMGLGRLNPNGSLDGSFNPAINYAQYSITCLLVQPDGKILVAGNYPVPFDPSPVLRKFVCRLNLDGSLDPTFYTPIEPNTPHSYFVFTLALQADGKVLVGGDFLSLAGETQSRVGRLNADGTLDATFHPTSDNTNASWPRACVFGLALQADGKLLAAGLFTELCGQPCAGFARLLASGPVTQSLAVNAAGTELTWTRDGPVPELTQVTFERSGDGTNYAFLGGALWTNSGWHLSGLSLPFGQRFILRARGRTIGSTGLIESTQEFVLAPKVDGMETPGDGTLTLNCTGAPTQACVLLIANSLSPSGQGTPVATNAADINGFVRFSGVVATNSAQRFFRLRQ
jgi:uncharacterized delta-60 repeat protein